MKTNEISIGPDMMESLGDCTVGDTKEITLRVKITGMGKEGLTGSVEEVSYAEPTEEEEPKPKKPAKRAPALKEAIGSPTEEEDGMGY